MSIATTEVAPSLEVGSEPAVPRHLASLERAHAAALRVGRALEAAPASRADVRPVAEGLERAIISIYDAYDMRADPLASTRDAAGQLDEVASSLERAAHHDAALAELVPMIRGARKALAVAEERFARAVDAPPPPEELRASRDVPRLHRVERSSLRPRFAVAVPLPPPDAEVEPLAPPKTFEALEAHFETLKERAEARSVALRAKQSARDLARTAAPAELPAARAGFAPGPHVALTPDELVRRRLRDAFEEVAMIGIQRAPLLGDPWRIAATLERRMLASIDAIASLGQAALMQLEPLVVDSPVKDPSRGFAVAMIAGCLDGRDALGAAERIMFALGPSDPEVSRQVGGALALVPHSRLSPMLRGWLEDADPSVRALAIGVLGYRGLARPDEIAAMAADPDPSVVASALPYAGMTRHPALQAMVTPALEHPHRSVREAAWAALAFGAHPFAADAPARRLASLTEDEIDEAAAASLALAITGDRAHAEAMLERFEHSAARHLAIALGWTGLVPAVPILITALEQSEPEAALSIAFALMRITGAELFDDVDVPPEKVDVPDVDEPDVGEPKAAPLARLVSDPRDQPSDGSPDRMRLPTIRADRWRAHWRAQGPKLDPAVRYRRGRPYTPLVSLFELDDYLLTPPERRWLQRELVVRTGRFVRFDPHDFVPLQEMALEQWVEPARSASGSPGAWVRPSAR